MGIFHVLLIMVLEKRVKLQNLKFAVSIDQGYNIIMQCLLISIHVPHPQKGLLNRAAVGWAVSCSAFGLLFFFLVLSVSRPKLPAHSANCCHRMMSPSANYRPFLSSFRHIPPQDHFVKLAN